jgi:hypothetical protein
MQQPFRVLYFSIFCLLVFTACEIDQTQTQTESGPNIVNKHSVNIVQTTDSQLDVYALISQEEASCRLVTRDSMHRQVMKNIRNIQLIINSNNDSWDKSDAALALYFNNSPYVMSFHVQTLAGFRRLNRERSPWGKTTEQYLGWQSIWTFVPITTKGTPVDSLAQHILEESRLRCEFLANPKALHNALKSGSIDTCESVISCGSGWVFMYKNNIIPLNEVSEKLERACRQYYLKNLKGTSADNCQGATRIYQLDMAERTSKSE